MTHCQFQTEIEMISHINFQSVKYVVWGRGFDTFSTVATPNKAVCAQHTAEHCCPTHCDREPSQVTRKFVR
jgi:hypothetical protein